VFPTPPSSSSSSSSSSVAQAVQTAFLQRVLPGFNLLLGPEVQPRVILSAPSTITDVKVLSSLSLVVVHNRPALLEVSNQIPVTTSTATLLSAPTFSLRVLSPSAPSKTHKAFKILLVMHH
jgi:general secretion pathway protein D